MSININPGTGGNSGGSGGGGGGATAAEVQAAVLAAIQAAGDIDTLIANSDQMESLAAQIGTNTSQLTTLLTDLDNNTDGLEAALATLLGQTDGLEQSAADQLTQLQQMNAKVPNPINNQVPVSGYDPVYEKLLVGTARDKFRDQFPSFDTVNNWEVLQNPASQPITTNGLLNGNRYLNINTGTTINDETIILSRKSFKLPLRLVFALTLSQRIANQEFFIELVGIDSNGNVVTDTVIAASPSTNNAKNCASYKFEGTTATQFSLVNRGFGLSERVVSGNAMTGNSTTASGTSPNFSPATMFELSCDMESNVWQVAAVNVVGTGWTNPVRFSDVTLDPTLEYKIRIRVKNLGTAPASATDFRLHSIRAIDSTRLTIDLSKYQGKGADQQSYLPVQLGSGTNTVGAFTLSGTANTVQIGNTPNTTPILASMAPNTAQGFSTKAQLIAAATTNFTLLKTGATVLGELTLSNESATKRFFKLYDKATAPVSTDTPIATYAVQPNSTLPIQIPAMGKRFALGLGIGITANAAANDNTAVAAGDIIANWAYA